jgi:hypothetical protein
MPPIPSYSTPFTKRGADVCPLETSCDGPPLEPFLWLQEVLNARSKPSDGSEQSRPRSVAIEGAAELDTEDVVEVCLDTEIEVEVEVESE